MLNYILLGFIWYQPSTGYEITQALSSSTGYFWHAYHSQIYTTLRRMEAQGLVTSHVEPSEDHLDRRVYEITSSGKQALLDWQNEPMVNLPKLKEELLVRIFFSGIRTPDEITAELRIQRNLHQKQLEIYQGIHISDPPPKPQHNEINLGLSQSMQKATLRFGLAYEKMYIQWLDELIAELQAN
jgi:PadR family transcriptional regulator AphA